MKIANSLIQFFMKLNILQEERNKDFATLIREEIQSVRGELAGFTERQGKRWRALGTRLVEFVGAGKSVGFLYQQIRLTIIQPQCMALSSLYWPSL